MTAKCRDIRLVAKLTIYATSLQPLCRPLLACGKPTELGENAPISVNIGSYPGCRIRRFLGWGL
jgi:hypothetical protein